MAKKLYSIWKIQLFFTIFSFANIFVKFSESFVIPNISISSGLFSNFDNRIVSNFAKHENPEINFFCRALVF